MVEINSKLTTVGDSYGFLIPKALVSCKVLLKGKRYKINVEALLEEDGPVAGIGYIPCTSDVNQKLTTYA